MYKPTGDTKQEFKGKDFEEAKHVFSPAALERWQNLPYKGRMVNPDGYARLTGKCGEILEIFLKFNGDYVSRASFMTEGCVAINICASFASEMAIGRNYSG